MPKKKPQPKPEPAPTAAADLPISYDKVVGLNTRKFENAVDRLYQITVEKKELAAEEEILKTLLVTLTAKAGVKSVMVGDLRATRMEGAGRPTIKRELLLENGVDLDVIQKSTVVSAGWTSFKVTDVTAKKDDSE